MAAKRKPTPYDALYEVARRNLSVYIGLVHRTDDGEQALPPRHLKEIVIPAVMDDNLGDTLIIAPPGSVKTNTMIGAVAHRLGNDPTMHVAYVCNTGPEAEKRSLAIRDTVEQNGFYRNIFPGAIPDPKRGWAANAWYLQRPNKMDKNPSLSAFGVGGGLGARLHFLVLDDIADEDNQKTELQRKNLWSWMSQTLSTRMHPTKGRIVMICMTGDTPVLMADGREKPLADVRQGDEIATYENGALTTTKVLNWTSKGNDFTYRIRMKSGITVRANERHPFLVARDGNTQWIPVGSLTVGDEIVRMTRTTERGKASSAPMMDAVNQQSAGASVCPTMGNSGGQMGTDHLPSTLYRAAMPVSNIGTALLRGNTVVYSRSRGVGVPSAMTFPLTMTAPIGAANSASITATRQEQSEAFSATTAILSSATGRPNYSSSLPLSTFGAGLDQIVSITPCGIEEVFDIQVERTENFIANGLVTHNCTRWHEEDPAAYAIERGWTVIRIPALDEEGESYWPEYFPTKFLACKNDEHDPTRQCCKKKELGSLGFARQYLGLVENEETSIFKRNWWRRYEGTPATDRGVITIDTAGWDNTSDRGDYAAICVASADGKEKHIRDVIRGRFSFNEVERILKDVRTEFPYPVVVEDVPWAKPLIDRLKVTLGWGVIPWKVQGRSKLNRAEAASPLVEQGNVLLPTEGRWLQPFIDELALFPDGKNDDQVDAFVMAIMYLDRTNPRKKPAGAKTWDRSLETVSA